MIENKITDIGDTLFENICHRKKPGSLHGAPGTND